MTDAVNPAMGALVVTGPTASGKSALALELASELGGEIISADSAQVYRGMDIGTAKPDADAVAAIAHHLIDIREPDDPYSASDFRTDAIRAVSDIASRGKVPVIAGGTMLYLKALRDGLAALPSADPAIRDEINHQASVDGWEKLHAELRQVDPASAARIKPSDSQRLQRALEVFRVSGVPLSRYHQQPQEACPFPLLEIAILPPDRDRLHKAMEERFHAMLAAGFVDEVRHLKQNPALHPELPAIRAVGYRQIWSYLEGDIDKQTMVEKALAATRQLAKRQYTWLRGWQGLHHLDFPDRSQSLKIIADSTILNFNHAN